MNRILLLTVSVLAWGILTTSLGAQAVLEEVRPVPANSPIFGPQFPGQLPSPRRVDPSTLERNALLRLKDIAFFEGERSNTLQGEGLIMGLSSTGGRSAQTQVFAENYFQRLGYSIPSPETRSMSVVAVQGDMPAYVRKGERFLVGVAVADDATSLRGGRLMQTPLLGIDGQIYAIAAGPIIGGGVSAGGQAATVQVNHPTAGECYATVEREICFDPLPASNIIRLVLRNKDYSTAVSVANALNVAFPRTAQAIDSGTIEVQVPRNYRRKLSDFKSIIGYLRVAVDQPARVVINQKTGTIVMGQNVRISNVVFGNESITIATTETPVADQPAPLSDGDTVVLPRTSVDIIESGGSYQPINGGITVGELRRALNDLGVSPNVMITIFSTLERQGALQAELIFE